MRIVTLATPVSSPTEPVYQTRGIFLNSDLIQILNISCFLTPDSCLLVSMISRARPGLPGAPVYTGIRTRPQFSFSHLTTPPGLQRRCREVVSYWTSITILVFRSLDPIRWEILLPVAKLHHEKLLNLEPLPSVDHVEVDRLHTLGQGVKLTGCRN